MYGAARPSRNAAGFGTSGNTSADAELHTSLTKLRAASRQMVRDSAYAKRARKIIVNNVIGSGIGLQAQVLTNAGGLRKGVNDAIEAAHAHWSEGARCHTGGELHLHDLERMALGEIFEAGEILVRTHLTRFGDSRVPLALEIIESERLPDMHTVLPGPTQGEMRMGVEVDRFGRPLAYWVRERHPGDIQYAAGGSERYERVPASDIFHLRIIDRWPQTRGEPWMHAVLRKLDDINELTGAELQAVRAAACYFGTISQPEGSEPPADDEEADGLPVMDIEPLSVQSLRPGEEFNFHAPNRPNAQLDAFLRHMVREMAAGTDVSYSSLSRDYSQGTYSSERQAMLEDRDTWRTLQQWWLRTFRLPLYRLWMRQAALAGAIGPISVEQYALDPDKWTAVRFKPRGWSWIDPTKEVKAYKEAINGGLTTITDVISQTADGRDIEDMVTTRVRELELLRAAGLTVDTAGVQTPAPPPAPPDPPPEDDDQVDGEGSEARGRVMQLRRGTA